MKDAGPLYCPCNQRARVVLREGRGRDNATHRTSIQRTKEAYAVEGIAVCTILMFGYSDFAAGLTIPANFKKAEVSRKPTNWKATDPEIAFVSGADLNNAHLEHLNGSEAFMVNAELRGANLSDADLYGADLRVAKIDHNAILRKATLSTARLEGADLTDANLNCARLDSAQIFAAAPFAEHTSIGQSLPM